MVSQVATPDSLVAAVGAGPGGGVSAELPSPLPLSATPEWQEASIAGGPGPGGTAGLPSVATAPVAGLGRPPSAVGPAARSALVPSAGITMRTVVGGDCASPQG